jgi:putative MATE family efflux protein
MRSLWIANGLNIVVAPFLVFGIGPFPKLGVTGAAIATTASRGVGIVYQVLMLVRGRARLSIAKRHLRPDGPVMRELARLGSSASLQTLIETASWLGLVRILSSYGSDALAGYSIAMRIVIFALLPSWGLSMAAATLVGQNLGARAPDRAERAVRTIGRYNVAFLGLVAIVFVAFATPLVRLFTTEDAVAAHASEALQIVSLGFVLYAYGMVCVQAFNGAGDTKTPMFVNLGCFWFFKIPFAYVLAKIFAFGPRGVFVAIAVAYSVQAFVAYYLFRRGRWKEAKVA